MPNKSTDSCQSIVDPMLSLFGGHDGGAAFVKLRHGVLPSLFSKPPDELTATEAHAKKAIADFSAICQYLLDN